MEAVSTIHCATRNNNASVVILDSFFVSFEGMIVKLESIINPNRLSGSLIFQFSKSKYLKIRILH
jgi:hypothetical protein